MTLVAQSVHLEIDQLLPAKARARRWSNAGGRAAFKATAHSGVEIAWLDAGGMMYRVGGRELELSPGHVMLIPAGVEHASEFLEGMAGGSVHLDDALIAQASDALGGKALEPGMLLEGVDVRALGSMLVDELARGGPDARLCASALVDALAVKAVRALPDLASSSSARDARVRTAIEIMRARYAEPLDVDEIAVACGTSRFHLSRLFKAATGSSPYQYLLDVRLEAAATMLRRGRSVTDAALSSGFADLSRFARMFSKRFGVLPKQYASASK